MKCVRPQIRVHALLLALATTVFVAITPCHGAGDEGPRTLRVAVKPIAPFVYAESLVPRGFSIDLWNEIARILRARAESLCADGTQGAESAECS